ncbi:hypothetical protein GW17_00037896 [Ensete ventricosum]|nr:hypothetical protein GW17_00037896 [Ensete ventricosum]
MDDGRRPIPAPVAGNAAATREVLAAERRRPSGTGADEERSTRVMETVPSVSSLVLVFSLCRLFFYLLQNLAEVSDQNFVDMGPEAENLSQSIRRKRAKK